MRSDESEKDVKASKVRRVRFNLLLRIYHFKSQLCVCRSLFSHLNLVAVGQEGVESEYEVVIAAE